MRFIQSVCAMLAVVVGLLLVGAFMVQSANAQPRTAPLATDRCDATAGPCGTGQGISITIVPPGSTPPPPPTPTPTPSPTVTDVPSAGPGGGGKPGAGGGTGSLPKTGPRETAITGAIGLAVLQLGLIMAVRAGRAGRAHSHA